MLRTIVDEVLNKDVYGYPAERIGTSIYITLDSDRFVKAHFDIASVAGSYEVLNLRLVSKTRGELEFHTVHFEDIFDNFTDTEHPNKIRKYIFRDMQGNVRWYGKPTQEDLDNIVATVRNFINIMK